MSTVVELRPIPGWEGQYSATADGHIWSHRTGRAVLEEWSHPEDPGRSHLRVRLHREGDRFWRYVHMLVAEAWLGARPAGHETCHRDGNRRHNAAANLFYATRSQNALDRERHRRERELEEQGELAGMDHHPYTPDEALGFL